MLPHQRLENLITSHHKIAELIQTKVDVISYIVEWNTEVKEACLEKFIELEELINQLKR